MPDIKYFITTGDGQNHQVSEDNIKNYGIDSYANAYKDATIRMRNDKGEDYHVPLTNYNDAVEQGLHPFRFDAAPQKSQHTDNFGNPPGSGSVAREVVQEYEKSLHSNPQPSRQPAQQVKPSNVPGYLDRDRTESVVQDRSSWANNDFSKHGINKVHDINTNIQKQQIQDSKPVVNTGVPQENQYIIKTQGQQRQQAEESASDLNKKYISPYVDEALTEADKQARDVIDKSQHLFYGASTGLPQGDVYHAAGMQDPDRILKGLQDNIQNIYSDPSFIQNINSEANRIGISPQDYYSKYVQPQIQDQLENTFSQKEILKHMPRNKSEYLINGLTEGITGMVLSRLLPKKEVQYMNAAQQATEEGLNKDYTPGTGDKLEKFAVSFTSDAPFFGLTGKIASATVGAVVKNQIEKLTAKGLAEGTARSIIGTQLENSVGKRVATKIMHGSLSGSANLGAYNVMSEGARQFRDREFNPAQILERGASGVGTGAALGVTGGIVGGLTSKLSGAKKLLASAANYLTEAGTFTVTGEAEKYLKGEGKDIRWGQDFLQNIEQLGVMKATGGHFMERMKNLVRPETYGVHFTKDEIEHIRTSKSANSLFSALSDMQPADSKFIKGENTESIKDPNIQAKRENLSKAYTDFMQDPNNTFAEKQKVAIVLGGTVPEYKPLETGYRIDNTDKGSTVTTTDANGNAVNMINFNSEEEANNYVSKHQNNIMANDVSTMSENYPEESQRLFQDFIQEGHTEGQLINALAGYDHSEEGTQILNNFQQKLSSRINQANCFSKGLLTTDPKERHDVKLNLDAQTESITSLFKDNDPRLLGWLQSDPESTIQKMKEEGYDYDAISHISNYLNAKTTYDGMIEGVRDEIDEKVNQNNDKINSITNQSDGLLHPATMRDGSQMYIVSGNVSLFDDGTIDSNNSDKSIIVRDPQTGEQKMIPSTGLDSIDETINSEDYRKEQEKDLRNYYSQKASDEIEGKLQFAPGDTYNIEDKEGNVQKVTVQQPVGDGTVQLTDGSVVPMDEIQQMSENYVAESNQIEKYKPFLSDDGKTIIPATLEDGSEVFLKDPSQNANNKYSNIDIIYKDEEGNTQTESIPASYIKEIGAPQMLEDYVKSKEDTSAPEIKTEAPVTEKLSNTEKDGVVRDENGNPIYEQSPIEFTISDMKKQGADENDILDYSSNMISDLDKESKALSKKKPEFSRDFATYKANKKALADQKEAIEKQKAYWKGLNDAISKPAEPTKTESPSLNKTTENPVIPTDSKPRNTGKYVKENKQMGDYLNLHDRVLRGIASGTKFLWNDDGVKKGLSTELGFKGSEGERKKRIGLLASKDKGGISIDELAHNIWEEREGQPWQNDDVSDIKNEIISVLSDNNGTRTMINEAMDMHEQPDEGDDSYEAQNYIGGFADSRHIDPEDVREFDSYADDTTKKYDEAASDEELNSIFAEKFLADDEKDINNKDNGQRETREIQEVRRQISSEGSEEGNTGGDSVLQEGEPSSEESTRQSSERRSSENDNARPDKDSKNVLSYGSVSRAGEDQSRPKLDQYEPIFQAAKDKAKELDSEIEKQNNAVSKANKIVERKREEISSRNGLFGDTKSTELFNETSDLSSDNLHKALDKYIKDYDFEKNKLDNLLANRDKKLKDIDEAESKQGDMFTSETPEEANVKRMSDIQERLSDIDSQLMELQDEGITESPQVDYLNEEKGNLESEYKGLQEINNESKKIQERKFTPPSIENESPLEYAQKVSEAHNRFKEEQKVNTNPSEAQKEAGNYKKGHIKLDGYDITIENPKGSERSGKDSDGKEWHTKMNNTYGYIRGTEGVDGDHIDVYLSNDPSKGDVYVVDQINPETGEFDEHKVMYGFTSALAAKRAYLSNYEKGWKGLGEITKVSKDDFKKWVDSSHRKTKPFSEYKGVKPIKTIEDLIREANGDKDAESTKNAQDILSSRGIDWTNSTVNNKNADAKRLKKIKDATENNGNFSKDNNDIRFSIRNKENLDKRYFEAIKNGNMEEAQRIIENSASLNEYSNLKDYEYAHKAPNSGGINKKDFRNLEKLREVVADGAGYPNLYAIGNGISSVPNDFFTPNGHRFYSEETPSDLESFRSIEEAIYNMNEQLSKHGEVEYIPKVRVYRAVPNSIKEGSVRNGGWVTPSKKYAEIHKESNLPGKGKIIEQDIPVDQLWWDGNSINEWGYDDGNNYTYKDTKNNKKLLDVITKDDEGNIIPPSKRFNIRNSDIRFNIKGKEDNQDTQLRDALIEKIRKAGIEVITDKNEIEKVLNPSDKNIRYLKTSKGEAYGFVKDGKMYIDTNIAGVDTPIHEYTHLWAEVVRKENPEEWKNIASLMKDLPIWGEVKKQYTNLNDEDSLAEEVLANYSGKRGAEKLKEEKERILKDESDIFTKAKVVDLFNRAKNAIEKFWHRVSDFLHIHYTTAEDVADQVLKDILNEVNPKSVGSSKDNFLHSKIMDENYRGKEDNIPSGDNIDDLYKDDGKMELTNRNIGPILYNMAGKYTRRMNKDGVPGMVVHDNKTNFDQAKKDYENIQWLDLYKDELKGILPRCTETAKDRVLRLISEIDRTLDYYKRQAEGEEMWRTADQPMFRTAYHGTDKDFDQFDLNHLGEGQGQNIAGNGIYVSDVKGVASKIKDMSKGDGYLYKVNIPDDTGSNYLDWNKTYKGEELQGIVDRIFKAVDGTKDASIKESNSFLNEQLSKHPEGVTGSSLYTLVRFSVDNPSNVLNKAGFVGTKYDVNMDKDYRDTLKGSVLSKLGKKSYSIFNEKDVKILQKEKDESQAKETMPIGKKTEDEISSIKGSVDSVSDKLGGMPVNYVDESNIPDNVKDKIDSTTKGWYDPKDGSVTLYTPNITSEDDAVRTVFHEKLGHEGLKALFGSDSEVNKFGDFIFKSANKELRDEITREAGRNGFPLSNPDGMSHAAQEVFARIAEEGPISENEFSLWRKVKHYVIDLLNKSGLHIKGILSDEDLRYYIQKTAEVLKTQKTSDGSSEVMFRKEGEPKKMKGENMRQFIDRLREWNKIEEARMDKEDPMPEYHPLDSGDFAKDAAAQSKYYDDYRQWKIRHNIYDIEKADDKFYNGEDDVIADPVKDKDIYLNSMDNARLEADPKAIERYVKTDIIERRKLINGSAAEDSLFMKDISDRTDAIAKSLNTTGKDIREALPFMIEGTYHGPIKVNEELETLMDDIKSWHDEMYNFLKEEGLYGEVGYLNNYISHIWDSEKSDAKAFENFVRTKNKYMQHRLVPTYQDGIDLGLVPKYKDVTEIMAEYGKTCAESVANNRLINAFKNYDIVDGDRRDPALSTISAPGYTRISVPGISDYPMADIWVHNSIKDRFNSVFGGKRTQGIPNLLTKTAHTLDLSASVMKKINLSVSGFHAVALAETLVGTEGPARALKDIAKYVIKESAFKGLPPAYAHPEDYKLAAKHLVRLGATDDYSIAEVQAITTRMRKIVEDFDKKHPKLADNPATFIAQTLDFMNKGFDTVLWKYIHDGFKLSGFKYYANSINQDFKDGKINGIERDKRLDEAGQMINDAFGGQFWDVINVSPALLKWMGRGLLSPDWTISTTRHGLSAMLGLGSLYSESGFQNYLFNNTKRMLGKDIPKNEYVDMRKKWGRQFYAIAFMAIGTMMNAINAYYRNKDEKEEKDKADEMRKSNPDYKSPYELAYPDGMKWYDYTMYGNSVGHQTHLFSGHYQDGTETYVRWGKQLREIPEMLYGRDGLSFPGPIIDRLSGKANPIINLTSNLFSGASLNGFDNPYMKNKRGWAKEIGRLHVIASCFLPYSIPTDEEKEFKMTDLFMPSQKGMTKWSTINHFKTAILSGDLDYVGQTYKAAVLNGIDAESCLKAATTEVKAGQRQEMSDGIKSLQMAMDSFDNAKTLDEKKHLKSKIVKYLADSGYKSFSEQEAVGKVKDFLNGDDLEDNEVNSDKYIMAATADDIRGDYKISALNKKSREITNKVQEMYSDGESPKMIQDYISHYKKWFEVKGLTSGYKSETTSLKKTIGKDKDVMKKIRSLRDETMKRIESLN